MNGTLLILGAGQMQLPAISAAKEMGLQVIAIDPSPQAPGLALADQQHVFDLADTEGCLTVAKANDIDGVMTLAAEYPIPTVAYIAETLGLPGITTRTAACATNKRAMRDAFTKGGVPSPASFSALTIDEAVSAMQQVRGPVIFKPTMSHGGRGITRIPDIATRAEIEIAFHRAMNSTRAEGILVEEFVDGPEFSIEAVTFGGETYVVAVTDKVTSGDPYFVELRHNQPSKWPDEDISKLVKAAKKGINALGIDWSPSHTEIRLTPDGPKIMEIGARLGGDYITTNLVPLTLGVDLATASILLALGREPDISPIRHHGAAVRFLEAEPGTIKKIEGLEDVKQLPGICEVSVYMKPGDQVLPLQDSTRRIGHVIAVAKTPDEAIALVEQAKDMIEIVLEIS